LGNVAADTGDGQAARQWYEQSIALYRAIHDRWSLARALYDLSRCLRVYGAHGTADQHLHELAEAKALAEQSLAICRELGDRVGIAASLHSMGVALLYQGQFAEAYASVKEAVTLYTGLGVRRGLVRSKTHLSLILGCLGQFEQAYAEADSALHLAQEVGYRRRVSDVYVAKVLISLRKELYDEVLGLYLEFAAICRETGEQFGLAIALGYLGCANVGIGQFAQARLALVEAFRLGVTMRSWMIVVFPIMYISQLWLKLAEVEAGAARLSRAEQAIELNALAMRYPAINNDSFWKNLCEAQIAAVAAILPPAEIAAAQERGRNRDLWATAAEVLAALESEAV
jgi:tetratricopeptide (TPR) repeat protein